MFKNKREVYGDWERNEVIEAKHLKQQGSFDSIVRTFHQVLESLPDKRTGKNIRYGIEDAALSAFSVFFTQTPSFLAYQRTMEKSKGHSNAQSLFGVHKIPSDNHIRDLLDSAQPEQIFPVFEQILQTLDREGHLDSFRALDDNLLVAIDGTEYFSSSQIHGPPLFNPHQENGRDHIFSWSSHASYR